MADILVCVDQAASGGCAVTRDNCHVGCCLQMRMLQIVRKEEQLMQSTARLPSWLAIACHAVLTLPNGKSAARSMTSNHDQALPFLATPKAA